MKSFYNDNVYYRITELMCFVHIQNNFNGFRRNEKSEKAAKYWRFYGRWKIEIDKRLLSVGASNTQWSTFYFIKKQKYFANKI